MKLIEQIREKDRLEELIDEQMEQIIKDYSAKSGKWFDLDRIYSLQYAEGAEDSIIVDGRDMDGDGITLIIPQLFITDREAWELKVEEDKKREEINKKRREKDKIKREKARQEKADRTNYERLKKKFDK